MPEYTYRGRDKDGKVKVGQRTAKDIDALNMELISEGIIPLDIRLFSTDRTILDSLRNLIQGHSLYLEELTIFFRQMQILMRAGVPIIIALTQLGQYTRSHRLQLALKGTISYLEKGLDLATSMSHFPDVFTPLVTDIVRIGESTGKLPESFEQLHGYLQFEYNNSKMIKSAFRYPIFLSISIIFAIIILNIFVIPTFAQFYSSSEVSLPWETRLLIGSSHFITHQGIYVVIALIIITISLVRYIKSAEGRLQWNHFELRIPIFGNLLKRLILIRFSQSTAIAINAGISVIQSLTIVSNIINNAYIAKQIDVMKGSIERGQNFTKAISAIELFSPIELQIMSVGERNGELGPALNYISEFHSREVEYDLKRINDYLGPILIAAVSFLILIVALGVYLPIWNMINLVK